MTRYMCMHKVDAKMEAGEKPSQELIQKTSALRLAGKSVGRFRKGPKDLSTSKQHLTGFGE